MAFGFYLYSDLPADDHILEFNTIMNMMGNMVPPLSIPSNYPVFIITFLTQETGYYTSCYLTHFITTCTLM